MLTVGISDECGGGNSGSRPLPSATVSCAVVPQAARPNIIADSISVFARIKHSGREISISVHRCARRSEEHTSELQSLMRTSYAVFCLKKKNNTECCKI